MPTNHPPPDPLRWRRERWDEPNTIYFWTGGAGRFEALSNFAPPPFAMLAWHDRETIVTFATGEHAFQAAKAPTPGEHEQIRLAPTPLAAKRAGRTVALPAETGSGGGPASCWRSYAQSSAFRRSVNCCWALSSNGAILSGLR